MCSIDKYVDLRGGYKNVLFGEGGGGKRVQNYFSTNAQPPLIHSRLRAGKTKKEKAGEGAKKQSR